MQARHSITSLSQALSWCFSLVKKTAKKVISLVKKTAKKVVPAVTKAVDVVGELLVKYNAQVAVIITLLSIASLSVPALYPVVLVVKALLCFVVAWRYRSGEMLGCVGKFVVRTALSPMDVGSHFQTMFHDLEEIANRATYDELRRLFLLIFSCVAVYLGCILYNLNAYVIGGVLGYGGVLYLIGPENRILVVLLSVLVARVLVPLTLIITSIISLKTEEEKVEGNYSNLSILILLSASILNFMDSRLFPHLFPTFSSSSVSVNSLKGAIFVPLALYGVVSYTTPIQYFSLTIGILGVSELIESPALQQLIIKQATIQHRPTPPPPPPPPPAPTPSSSSSLFDCVDLGIRLVIVLVPYFSGKIVPPKQLVLGVVVIRVAVLTTLVNLAFPTTLLRVRAVWYLLSLLLCYFATIVNDVYLLGLAIKKRGYPLSKKKEIFWYCFNGSFEGSKEGKKKKKT